MKNEFKEQLQLAMSGTLGVTPQEVLATLEKAISEAMLQKESSYVI